MTPAFTAPTAGQSAAAAAIGGGAHTMTPADQAITDWASTRNLAPQLVKQFADETGQQPGDNFWEWAQDRGYWNGQSGPGEQWKWHKVLGNGQTVQQGNTGVYGDPTKGFTIQPNGNAEDILRKMLTQQDYGLTTSGDTSLSNAATGLNSGNLGQTLQSVLQQAYASQDPTKSDTANYSQSWAGQAPTDPSGALKNFIGDQLSQRMKWVNEGNNDENTTINQNLRSLQSSLYGGVGTTPGATTRQSSLVEQYLNALPNPNKIVGREWVNLDKDTRDFLTNAYEQQGAAGNENGYSANDINDAVLKGLPQFTAPKAGLVA